MNILVDIWTITNIFGVILLLLIILIIVISISKENVPEMPYQTYKIGNHSENYDIDVAGDEVLKYSIINEYNYINEIPTEKSDYEKYVAYFFKSLDNAHYKIDPLILASNKSDVLIVLDIENNTPFTDGVGVIIYNNKNITFKEIDNELMKHLVKTFERELILIQDNMTMNDMLEKLFSLTRYRVPFENGYPVIIGTCCFYSYKIVYNAEKYPHNDDQVIVSSLKLPKIIKTGGKIPKIIHQTFEHLVIPESFVFCMKQWQKLNPEYEYRYWTGNDSRKFIVNNFDKDVLEAYDALYPGAYRADFWRVCALYFYGGVYADIKLYPLLPLEQIIGDDTDIVLSLDFNLYGLKRRFIYNAFFAVSPRHKYLKDLLDVMVDNIKNRKYNNNFIHTLSVTGPSLWSDILYYNIKKSISTGNKYIDYLGNARILEHIHVVSRPDTVSDNNGVTNLIVSTPQFYNKSHDPLKSIYWKCTGKRHYTVEKTYIDSPDRNGIFDTIKFLRL